MTVQMKKRGGQIDEHLVNLLEEETDASLPEDYRQFLLEFNGGEPEVNEFRVSDEQAAGVNQFFGLTQRQEYGDLRFQRRLMLGRVPENMLPIANAEGGNLVCISVAVDRGDYGAIYFWDHELEAEEDEDPSYENLHKIADNFNDFWESLSKFDISKVVLKEGDVEEAWIDPDFLAESEDE